MVPRAPEVPSVAAEPRGPTEKDTPVFETFMVKPRATGKRLKKRKGTTTPLANIYRTAIHWFKRIMRVRCQSYLK